MTGAIKRGMVLSAGLGTRLKPITLQLPKPLVPVLNIPNVLYTLSTLKRAGVSEIILNLHYLPESIERFLGEGQRWGLKLQYSREQSLLGTGGGVKKVERFFAGEPFVLANCDFITDLDLSPYISRHFSRNSLATMILYENAEKQVHYSKVGVSREHALCSLPSLQTSEPARVGIFTGIHLLDSKTLTHLKEEPCGINDRLYPFLMKSQPDKVFGDFMKDSFWLDTGEPGTLWDASMSLLEALNQGNPFLKALLRETAGYEEKREGVWMPRECKLPPNEIMSPAILGKNVQLGKGVVIGPYTVLDDGATVAEHLKVSRFVGIGAPKVTPSTASKTLEGNLQFQGSLLSTARGS